MALKVMATVDRRPGGPAADLRSWCSGGRGWVASVVDGWVRAVPGSMVGVLSAPVDGEEEAAAVATGLAAEWGVASAWLVDERPRWDGATPSDGFAPVAGHKQVSFLRRLPSIDHAAFVAAWDRHATLARRHHPALWRYTQNWVVAPLLPGTADLDGIAELAMRLRLDFVERMYDSPAGRAVIAADVGTFIDVRAGWRVHTREYRSQP